MKKIMEPRIKSFGHVKINEVEALELINIVKRCENIPIIIDHEYDRFSLKINNYELESEEEIKKFLEEKIESIDINFSSMLDILFFVTINKKGGIIFCNNDHPYCVGLFQKGCNVLQKCKRKFQWSEVLLYPTVMLIFGLIMVFTATGKDFYYYIGLAISIVDLLCFLMYMIFMPFRKTIISFSKDNDTFWTRNKDQIIMLIIGTVIGAIIKTFVDALIGKIK